MPDVRVEQLFFNKLDCCLSPPFDVGVLVALGQGFEFRESAFDFVPLQMFDRSFNFPQIAIVEFLNKEFVNAGLAGEVIIVGIHFSTIFRGAA